MKGKFFLSILLIHCVSIFSYADTSLKDLVRNNMSMHSELEKRVMLKIDSGQQVTMLELILATDKFTLDSDFERINKDMEAFIEALKKETASATMSTKIRYIFTRTHQKYLRKYEAMILASDLFINGYYNCVTATALYAHVLGRLNIPYQIKEAPNHVYLIADPENSKIPIESTDPKQGYMKPSASMKNEYIRYLLDSKLITREELDSNGTDKTFENHYYSKTNINDKELAALQYSNIGVFSLEKYDAQRALVSLEKSYYLYPSDRIKMLMVYEYEYFLPECSYIDSACISRFLKSYYAFPKEIRTPVFYEKFVAIKDQVLVSRADQKLFDVYYERIKDGISTDSILLPKIKFLYQYEKGRYALLHNDYQNALKYIYGASFIEPKNIELKQMVELSITRQVVTISNPAVIINKLNNLCESYSFIKEYPITQNILGLNYLKLALERFEKNKPEEALYFMDEFEELKSSMIEPEFISNVYIKAADAYLKVNNRKKAISCLDKGLAYVPNDPNLLKKRNSL